MDDQTKTVTATCGMWRGLRRGETGVVAADGVTAYALANGLCKEVKPAKSRAADKAEAPPAEDAG